MSCVTREAIVYCLTAAAIGSCPTAAQSHNLYTLTQDIRRKDFACSNAPILGEECDWSKEQGLRRVHNATVDARFGVSHRPEGIWWKLGNDIFPVIQ